MAISPLPGSHQPDPSPLGRSLDRIVRHLGGPSADAVTALFADWATIVGSPLDGHTHPLSLTDRCLVVAVDDPAWASQLRFLERELRGQVNDRLGPGAVDQVQFRVRPAEAATEAGRIDPGADPVSAGGVAGGSDRIPDPWADLAAEAPPRTAPGADPGAAG